MKFRGNEIDLEALRILSDLVKEKELGWYPPNNENGCYIPDYWDKLVPTLKEILPYTTGKITHPFSRYRTTEYVPIFEKDAIKMLLKLVGVKAPSNLYHGKGSYRIPRKRLGKCCPT